MITILCVFHYVKELEDFRSQLHTLHKPSRNSLRHMVTQNGEVEFILVMDSDNIRGIRADVIFSYYMTPELEERFKP